MLLSFIFFQKLALIECNFSGNPICAHLCPSGALQIFLSGTAASFLSLFTTLCGVAYRTRPLLPPHIHCNLISALCNGRVATYAAAATSVRLAPAPDELPNLLPASSLSAQVQVIINDVARATLGRRRSDRVPVRQLLDQAGLRSLNEAAFVSSGMLAWSAINCESHPLHKDLVTRTLTSSTRASATGKLRPLSPREADIAIAVANAIRVWNAHPDIRAAMSMSAAKANVKRLARSVPV